MVLSPNPDKTGFAAVTSAGTELGCQAVEPRVVLSPNPEEDGTTAELGDSAVTEP